MPLPFAIRWICYTNPLIQIVLRVAQKPKFSSSTLNLLKSLVMANNSFSPSSTLLANNPIEKSSQPNYFSIVYNSTIETKNVVQVQSCMH